MRLKSTVFSIPSAKSSRVNQVAFYAEKQPEEEPSDRIIRGTRDRRVITEVLRLSILEPSIPSLSLCALAP
jgi:hypothetical protein